MGVLRALPPAWRAVFFAFCFICFSEHLFAARMSSFCSFTNAHFTNSYYCDYPAQAMYSRLLVLCD